MKLKELSDLLGLSPTTVSRALNNYPEVSAATRERVKRAAMENNYRPNKRAQGLVTGRAYAIGHIIPLDSQNEVTNPVFGEFLAGASTAYNQHGYELTLSFTNGSDEEKIYRDIAARGAVDGVVLQLPKHDDHRIALLKEIGLPFVVHGRVQAETNDYSWVDVDNHGGFRQATQLLIDLGHRNIALINGLESLDFAYARREGYLRALKENGISPNPERMSSSEMTETHGYHFAQQMLNVSNPPSAFLASSYVMGLGVRRAISEAGLTIGDDISVIVHDDELSYFSNDGDTPIFTGTRSSVRAAGAIAADMLLQIIGDPSIAPMHRLLESRLTIGKSTGPAKAAH